MIITVTMNPAIDKTAEIATLKPGGLNRLENIVLDAGGKGINVSKMIAALGGDSTATGFLGGGTGKEIITMLQDQQIKTDFVTIKHPTRTNLKVLNRAIGITEFNEPGATVTQIETNAIIDKLLSYAKPGTTFVLAGSLPHGADIDIYKRITASVKEKGATVFLDTDGEAFSLALSAKPDYIKPNKFELMQYFGKSGDISVEECAGLCLELIRQGVTLVALSMGADGALFITKDEKLYAPGLRVNALSTVGAGDSMVGALVYAFSIGMNLQDAAALSIAASAGAVMTQGTKPPSRRAVDELLKAVIISTCI